MKKLIYIFLILLVSIPAYTQGDGVQYNTEDDKSNFNNVPSELTANIDVFFKILISGNVKNAFKGILKNSPILEKEEDLINLVKQTKKSINIYGDIKDYEPVNVERATPSFIRLRYIGLHTRFPMRWIFTYYKSPKSGWTLTNIKFDDLSEFYFSDE